MHHDQVQKALDRVQRGQTHVLDLLGDVRPVNLIHPLPPPKATKQIRLMLRPSEDITFIKTIRHEGSLPQGALLRQYIGDITHDRKPPSQTACRR